MSDEDRGTEFRRLEVGREHHTLSLFDLLDARAGPLDRKAVRAAAQRAELLLNGEAAGLSQTVRAGDVVDVLAPLDELRGRPGPPWEVLLHEDELVVAVKPAGMPFDAGRVGRGTSLLERLQYEVLGGSRPHAVYRLDKDTSGLAVLATGRQTARTLAAAFASGEAWVEYVAIVRGAPDGDEGLVQVPLAKARRSAAELTPDPARGSPAETAWRVAEALRGYTVLRLRPRGGRSHQVRAHLAALGLPALCDRAHGEDDQLLLSRLKLDYRPKRGRPERPLLARPALHAESVQVAGRRLRAPLPKDMAVLLATLRRLRGTDTRPPESAGID